jgi:hypothetical protein
VLWFEGSAPAGVFVHVAESCAISVGHYAKVNVTASSSPDESSSDIVDVRPGCVCIQRLNELRAV